MAGETFDLIVKEATAPGGETFDIGVRDGRIAAVGTLERSVADQCLEARGLHTLPGVIDSHVHFREPGSEESETLESGSRAAVLGGVCTVFDMPNTRPAVISQEALDGKRRLAEGRMHTDYAFFIGATRDNHEWLAEAERQPGVAGVKLFMGSSTGDLLVDGDEGVLGVLKAGTRRVAVHSEDEARLRGRQPVEGDPSSHPVWRDAEAARLSTERLLRMAAEAGRPVHVLHLTSADEIPLLEEARASHPGLVTVEATPHHLLLEAETAYGRLGTLAQVNPPIRGRRHRHALLRALAKGIIDSVASDHAPHTLEAKRRPYPQSPSGVPGTATLLPLLLNLVARGDLTLKDVERLACTAPAVVYGLRRKGRIKVGFDADLTLVDLGEKRRIENGPWVSKCGWTPYDGMEVQGWPKMTVLRGKTAMAEGEVAGPPSGRPAEFGVEAAA